MADVSEIPALIRPTAGNLPIPPEGGVSLARTGDDATMLRRRLERPARLGRTILVIIGGITASAGIADLITTRSTVGIAIAVFGFALLALGVVQHLLYQRDLKHWPTDVLMWDEGVELVLANGEVRGVMWSDADIALQLVSRKAPKPAEREYLLLWLQDSKIPAVELSAEGYDRLTKTAADAGLQFAIVRRGHRTKGTQLIQIRPALPPPIDTTAKLSQAEVQGPD